MDVGGGGGGGAKFLEDKPKDHLSKEGTEIQWTNPLLSTLVP